MRIRVKIILALLIGTFCFTTYGVQAANVQASKEKMSGYGRSEKARKELKKRKKSKKADVSPVKELTPEQQRRYDYFFLEAARLKVQKDYDAAFDVLQHCLTINPNASSALYEMAQYYMYLKQVPLGQAALEKAVENAPDNYWYARDLPICICSKTKRRKPLPCWKIWRYVSRISWTRYTTCWRFTTARKSMTKLSVY